TYPPTHLPTLSPAPKPRLAIAQDAAFSFYYPDNLDILKSLGAELIPWSPLRDEHPPADIDGLYFGGGFPEMFAAQLAANQELRTRLNVLLRAGLPAYAECGGLMYLAATLVDLDDQPWPMVGLLPTTVRMTPRLTLGYRQAMVQQPSFLLAQGQSVWGHEFHRSQTETEPDYPVYQLKRYGAEQPHAVEGWSLNQVQASYLHLHWGGCPEVAQALVAACIRYRKRAVV
ncbi:cobyrinate a,c-diamide synthase, partial [Nodosilinea sp. AN01ver1]